MGVGNSVVEAVEMAHERRDCYPYCLSCPLWLQYRLLFERMKEMGGGEIDGMGCVDESSNSNG